MTNKAAIIGGGVIGGGWAARFLLNGWDVSLFDPDPDARQRVDRVLANARRALPGLSDVALPTEGRLTTAETIAEAVSGADWIQESVPERLEVKHRVLADIQADCPTAAVIGSSTSGFRPSELQQNAIRPEQVVVCHPFNPVYLLPLVEVVGLDGPAAATAEKARDVLAAIGMKPLLLRREIDAHIADRLLESVWRESLWLVRDEIATTQEIDDAIRYGFGLRWAQMGLFETYRIAGGEAGMAHFLEQFGPCLAWPWSRLTDVPELDQDLVRTIAEQSDRQSGGQTIAELEQIRDANLVAILRALKGQDQAAGALLNRQDRQRLQAAPEVDYSKPLRTLDRVVPLDWTDYNGHMNEARYLEAFSTATDRFMQLIGCDAAYIASGNSYFTAETHIRHLDEVEAGQPIHVESLLLSGQGKRMHIFNTLWHGDGRLLATGEQMLLHVSLKTRRTSEPAPALAEKLAMIEGLHARLPRPDGIGRAIRQRK